MYISSYMDQKELSIVHAIMQMCIVAGDNSRAKYAVKGTECDQCRFLSYKPIKTLTYKIDSLKKTKPCTGCKVHIFTALKTSAAVSEARNSCVTSRKTV
jgi:hypothetical protein